MFPIKDIDGLFGICGNWRPVTLSSCSSESIDRIFRHAHKLAPVRYAQTYPINLYPSRKPGIAGLLSGQRPSAIARFVVSIVVDAVKRMSLGWTSTHVSEKVFKTVAPPLAHFNSSPPPSGIARIVWVMASKFHLCPDAVLNAFSHVVRSLIGISGQQCASRFFGETAATERGPTDVSSGCDRKLTAIASATPHRVARIGDTLSLNDKQTSKSFPSNIKGLWHTSSGAVTPCNYRHMGV